MRLRVFGSRGHCDSKHFLFIADLISPHRCLTVWLRLIVCMELWTDQLNDMPSTGAPSLSYFLHYFRHTSLCSFTLRPDLIFKLRLSTVDPGDTTAPRPHPLPVSGNITSRTRDYPTHPPKTNNHLRPATGEKKLYIYSYVWGFVP